MKIGFTISCYDKFEEVDILSEIIKLNFKKIDSKICLGSNNAEAEKYFKENKHIDYLAKGEDIKFKEHSTEARLKKVGVKSRAINVIRTYSNTRVAVQKLLEKEPDLDYIVILHSDSWIFNEKKLLKLIELMEKKEKKVAVRGLDFQYIAPITSAIEPYVVDFFIILNKEYCAKNKMFDFEILNALPGSLSNVHMVFFWLLAIKIGLEKVICYSTYKDLELWDGKKVFREPYLTPMCYDPLFEEIHINKGSFFEDLGQQLQAHYLRKYNFKGENIKCFLEKYNFSKRKLFDKLNMYDKKYNKKLKRIFSSYEYYGLSRSHKNIDKDLKRASLKEKILRTIFIWLNTKRNKQFDLIKEYEQFNKEKFKEHKKWYESIFLTNEEKKIIREIK